MKFSFRNLGIIEDADIELNGLTILTGLNDTGKSFISKAIYSIIKALNESTQYVDRKKYNAVSALLNQISLAHRQIVPYTQEKVQKFNTAPLITKAADVFINKTVIKEELKTFIDSFKEQVVEDIEKTLQKSAQVNQRLALIKQAYESIQLNFQDISNEEKFNLYFDEEIIQKLFQAQINSIEDENKALTVEVFEGETQILNFSVLQNKTQVTPFPSSALSLSIKNATIIETPVIVNLERYITFTLAYIQQSVELPSHYIDICRKISYSTANTSNPNPIMDILANTKKIIGGQVIFSTEQGGIVFVKDNGSVIRVNNMATGIKSFGLIQMLLNSGVINPASLLIIDEPEVHLHLKWQLLYAEIIVALSSIGVPIIISTHSPFFLEALTAYVSKYQRVDQVTVYNSERNEATGKNSFKDVTKNLDKIFEHLSEPVAKLQMIS